MSGRAKRIQTPMLAEYLRGVSNYPSYAPQLSEWGPWIAFFAVFAVLQTFIWSTVAFGAALTVALCLPRIVRVFYPPKTEEDREEAAFLNGSRRIRSVASDGSLRGVAPPEVLEALETAAAARAVALARLHALGIPLVSEEGRAIERAMRAAVLAAGPVVRGETQGRREWEAVRENKALIVPIVEAIESQARRLGSPLPIDVERLSALRELEDLSEPEVREQA